MLFKYLLVQYIAIVTQLFLVCNFKFVRSDSEISKQSEIVFKKLFKARRTEQLEAVRKIRTLPEDKQEKMVKSFAKTLFEVISKSKVILENFGYVPGVSEFPETEKVRDALSLVLENSALMGEVALRLPDVTETVLRSSPEWATLLSWSLNFANQTGLLDNPTSKLVTLVSQELNFTPKTSDFINPYRKVRANNSKDSVTLGKEVKKKKKRAEIPRGPRLTLPQTGEL